MSGERLERDESALDDGAPAAPPRRWRLWILAGFLGVELAVLLVMLATRRPDTSGAPPPYRVREAIASRRRELYRPERDPRVGGPARPLKLREGKRETRLEAFRRRRVVIVFARGDEG